MAERKRSAAQPSSNAKVLTAAAERIRVDEKRRAVGYRKPEVWQKENWEYYDLIGEVKQAGNFIANVVANARLFIGELPDDPEQEPGPVQSGSVGAFEAEEALDRLRSGSVHGGLGGLLAASVLNLKITGEKYLLGEPERPPKPEGRTVEERLGSPERWSVKSIDEIDVKNARTLLVKDSPEDRGRELTLPGPGEEGDDNAAFLLRVWQRHPRFGDLADCSLAACRTECEELLILSRAIRGVAKSRIATAGLLFVPSELSFGSADTEAGDDDQGDPFQKELTDAMMTAIRDEDDAKGVVPILLRGPSEHGQHIKHYTFDRPLDAEASKLRTELIGRLGHSLDIPVEQLTGLAGVNHWTAWQVDGASWSRYGHPTLRLIVESWTEGYLWPALDAAGIDPVAARRLIIWFDPADAIVDPDESKTADELLEHAAIGFEAYRTRKGASEQEAPTPEELDEMVRLGILRGSRSTGDMTGPPNGGDAPESPDARSRAYPPGSLGDRNQRSIDEEFRRGLAVPTVAAAARRREPLGRRLMQIDRSLRARLDEVAEAAVRRALERAGARVRSAVQSSPNLAAAVSTVPAHLVAAHLGCGAVSAAVPPNELDLHAIEPAIAGFLTRFDSRVLSAQRQVRRELATEFDLSDAELGELERTQDRDRGGAWMWLSGALASIARERLYDPLPAPEAGEFDASSSVPQSVLREALARAGGGLAGADEPQGGVATGLTALDVWQQHGRVVGGWEWVYGDPGSRTRAFPAHERLDGVQFANWSDPVLTVDSEDRWLGVAYYRPGDHDWCQCDFVPLAVEDNAEAEDLAG